MIGRWLALAALLLLTVACTGPAPSGAPTSGSQPSSGASPVATSGPVSTATGFSMCQLMPEGEVIAQAPFTIAFDESEPWGDDVPSEPVQPG